jgi:hydrogenase maturation factor HypE
LECNVFKLQEVALRVTDSVVSRLDYVYTKNKILPRLLQMCLDPNIQARATSISTLKKIHQVFDRNSINDLILPTIDKMRKLGYMNKDLADIVFQMYTVFCESMNNEVILTQYPLDTNH